MASKKLPGQYTVFRGTLSNVYAKLKNENKDLASAKEIADLLVDGVEEVCDILIRNGSFHAKEKFVYDPKRGIFVTGSNYDVLTSSPEVLRDFGTTIPLSEGYQTNNVRIASLALAADTLMAHLFQQSTQQLGNYLFNQHKVGDVGVHLPRLIREMDAKHVALLPILNTTFGINGYDDFRNDPTVYYLLKDRV